MNALQKKYRLCVLVCAAALAFIAALVGPVAPKAQAFGTIDSLGQHREHEKITRMALGCQYGRFEKENDCFEPKSLDQLAGKSGTFGAVGYPDRAEITDPNAHCDNADFLASDPEYYQSRLQATQVLFRCVSHLRDRFNSAAEKSQLLVSSAHTYDSSQWDSAADCLFSSRDKAKCQTILEIGRLLHGVQDIYSHSNWTDWPNSSASESVTNPPGLHQNAPMTFLDMMKIPDVSEVPTDFSTGCFSLFPNGCNGRITHDVLNKDEGNGYINIVTGQIPLGATSRGMHNQNFRHAVEGAVAESRRQWASFRRLLVARYGYMRGDHIACVLTHDEPSRDCFLAGAGLMRYEGGNLWPPVANYSINRAHPWTTDLSVDLLKEAHRADPGSFLVWFYAYGTNEPPFDRMWKVFSDPGVRENWDVMAGLGDIYETCTITTVPTYFGEPPSWPGSHPANKNWTLNNDRAHMLNCNRRPRVIIG
nr:hypothetical protein [Streptomyces chartreusis]